MWEARATRHPMHLISISPSSASRLSGSGGRVNRSTRTRYSANEERRTKNSERNHGKTRRFYGVLRSSFFVLRSSFFVLRSSFFVLRSLESPQGGRMIARTAYVWVVTLAIGAATVL